MNKFYVVMRDKVETHICKRHANLEDARAEAERLSRKEKAIFFVLEMVGYAEPQDPPIMWVEIAGRGRSVTMI